MEKSENSVRVDRFLWSCRQFKTRSLSTDACKRSWVEINKNPVKPSREVNLGDIITIRRPFFSKTIKVLQILKQRVGAKLLVDYIEDMTPEEEYNKEKEFRKNQKKSIGSSSRGRPSKKQRRDLEEFFSKNS